MKRIIGLWASTIAACVVVNAVHFRVDWKLFWLLPTSVSPTILWGNAPDLLRLEPLFGLEVLLVMTVSLTTVGWAGWQLIHVIRARSSR